MKLTKPWGAVKFEGAYIKAGFWDDVSLKPGAELEEYDAPVKEIEEAIEAANKARGDKYVADRASALAKIKTATGLSDIEMKLVFGG